MTDLSSLYPRTGLPSRIENTNIPNGYAKQPALTQTDTDRAGNAAAAMFYPTAKAGNPGGPVGPTNGPASPPAVPAVTAIAETFAPPAGWVDVPGHAAIRGEIGELFVALGLKPEDAQPFVEQYRAAMVKPITTTAAVAESTLRREWGADFDERMRLIKYSIDGIAGLREVLNGPSQLGNSVAFAQTAWKAIEHARAAQP